MSTLTALPILADLAVQQWGMFTTAQAHTRGISRLQLARLNAAGAIERVVHGIYRECGVPTEELDALRATWLSLSPSVTVDARLVDPATDFVISGLSATQVHGFGDWYVPALEFSSPQRKQSQRKLVKFRHRTLSSMSVTIVDGLPVTTLEQTIVDLLTQSEDFSNVARAFADLIRDGRIFLPELEMMLDPISHRLGFKREAGKAVIRRLHESANIDPISLAKQFARRAPTIAKASALFASLNHNPEGSEDLTATIGDLTLALQKLSPEGITQIVQLTELLNSAEPLKKRGMY